MMSADQALRKLVREDGRFRLEAYEFIFAALETTLTRLAKRDLEDEVERHVSGPELLEGIRLTALDHFGYLARSVFDAWGVHTTDDFGEIVFALVERGLLKKRPEDSPEDFHDVYRFEEALDGPALADISWPPDAESE